MFTKDITRLVYCFLKSDELIKLFSDDLSSLRVETLHVFHFKPGISHGAAHHWSDNETAHAKNICIIYLPGSSCLIYTFA